MANHFVDFSATFDGDGTSPSQASGGGQPGAYNTIFGKSFNNGDFVWIRRKTLTVSSAQTLTDVGVTYVGWPVGASTGGTSGTDQDDDIYYATRPAVARALWDDDPGEYAVVESDGFNGQLLNVETGISQEFHRIEVSGTGTGSSIENIIIDIDSTYYNCYFHTDATYDGAVRITGGDVRFYSCILERTGSTSSSAFVYSIASSGEIVFKDCTIVQIGDDNTYGREMLISGGGRYYFINCILESEHTSMAEVMFRSTNLVAVVYMADCVMSDASTSTSTSNIILELDCKAFIYNLDVVSCRKIDLSDSDTHGSIIHFKNFTQAVNSDYAIESSAGVIITGSNFSFATNSVSNFSAGVGQHYFVQNVESVGTMFGTNEFGAFVGDIGGVVGSWSFFGSKGTVSTNSVNRTGGESYSLKYDMDSGDVDDPNNYFGLIPFIHGLETIYASVPASASTIVVYGAYKNYGGDPPLQDDLYLETDYLSEVSGGTREFASSKVAVDLLTDGSSWVGDSGLTPFKLELPITPGQSGIVPVRVHLTKRKAGAFLYIDPKPEVV